GVPARIGLVCPAGGFSSGGVAAHVGAECTVVEMNNASRVYSKIPCILGGWVAATGVLGWERLHDLALWRSLVNGVVGAQHKVAWRKSIGKRCARDY
ncbi:MAG: hypothetical protein JAZ03_10000, partial [Candidatus Thiodiazotropha taylori]|nr:hypothetical protein [Candidatus Thiodiazotropha taylori]MCW4334258.1 hypothetical protein [Candidatus Thiodiazotropha endolucinida]